MDANTKTVVKASSIALAAISFWIMLSSFISSQRNIDSNHSHVQYFEGTFEEALQIAAKESKPLFVKAYADWCGPCRAMDKKEMTDKELSAFLNSNFINFKLNTDKSVSKATVMKYQIESLPTLLFILPNGELKERRIGYQKASTLLSIAKNMK